ncbi:MAG: hypothetical protein F6K48_03105 [Okeania sp. SIO3H1]|nr:hypothetical protein [Okeania sp. SIO3H1]
MGKTGHHTVWATKKQGAFLSSLWYKEHGQKWPHQAIYRDLLGTGATYLVSVSQATNNRNTRISLYDMRESKC